MRSKKFKYSVRLQWSEEDKEYVALIPEMPGVSALAETPEEAAREVQVAASLYIDFLKSENEPLPEPRLLSEHSGQLRLRMPHSLHERLAIQAEIEGVSLNSFINHLLSSNANRGEINKTVEKCSRPLKMSKRG